MDDICRQMGISKKTLYKWFDNKDAIVQAVISSHLSGVQTGCCQKAEQSHNAIHELFLMMEMMRESFRNIHPSIFRDLQKHHPEAWHCWLTHKCDFVLQQIKANIKRGIEEKLYRADIDVEVMARLRLATLDIAFNDEVFPPQQYNIEKVQLACLEHFMLGIATLKGHRLINRYKHITEEE